MKTRFTLWKKVLSVVLCVLLVLSCSPLSALAVTSRNESAPGAAIGNAWGGTGNKLSDAPTLNDWQLFFGPNVANTTWAGGIWTDKSVFNSVADYVAATDEKEGSDFALQLNDSNSFLVSLSAIAASKSVEGYSALPSDTILVLDLSASMESNKAVDAMVRRQMRRLQSCLR